jgi:hypothetical protein
VFIIVLFIIAKLWNQLRCPSLDEWIEKRWYIDAMEYYSAIKKNEISWALVAHTCTSGYSGSRDQEVCGLRPVQAK